MKPVISIHHGLKIRLGNHAKAAEVLDNFGVAYEKESCFRTPYTGPHVQTCRRST